MTSPIISEKPNRDNLQAASEDDSWPEPADDADDYQQWITAANHHIEHNIDDSRWLALLAQAKPCCMALTDQICSDQNHKDMCLSVLWTDDETITQLNTQFRQKHNATNILSFPGDLSQAEKTGYVGDMVLAYETVIYEAESLNRPVLHHIAHLFVHGLLHLYGFDHHTEAEATMMETKEIMLLAGQNIPNPYTEKE